MMRAIRFAVLGGPEVLTLADVPLPTPGPNQVRVRAHAIGVNMIDTYFRKGVYPVQTLPAGLGGEVCGTIDALGDGVTGWRVGQRVGSPKAAATYAEFCLAPADTLVAIPDAVPDAVAASVLVKGFTARYLCKQTFPVKAGDWALVFAAAGGTGQILTQWAAALGAHVIAVVSTDAKGAVARRCGAQHVVLSHDDVAKRVREIVPEGVHVSYDSVGKDSFEASLASLRPLGMFVSYGNASGPVPAFEPLRLSKAGSLFFTRPVLFDYIRTPAQLREAAADVFESIVNGTIKVAARGAERCVVAVVTFLLLFAFFRLRHPPSTALARRRALMRPLKGAAPLAAWYYCRENKRARSPQCVSIRSRRHHARHWASSLAMISYRRVAVCSCITSPSSVTSDTLRSCTASCGRSATSDLKYNSSRFVSNTKKRRFHAVLTLPRLRSQPAHTTVSQAR